MTPGEPRIVDVTQDALRRRELRTRRVILLYSCVPAAWSAAVLSYVAAGRHLPAGLALVLEFAAAFAVLALLVLLARPGADPTFSSWRSRVLGQRRPQVVVLIALATPFWAWLATVFLMLLGPELALVFGGMSVPMWLLTAPALPALSRLWTSAGQSPAAEVLRRDGRAPVVYLRSFAVDRSGVPGGLLRYSFEEALVQRLWSHGPVIAAARPIPAGRWGEPREAMRDGRRVLEYSRDGRVKAWKSLPVDRFGGAARSWLPAGDWQRTVVAWLQAASLVAVVIGGSEGLTWELQQTVRLRLAGRLIVVLPPLSRDLAMSGAPVSPDLIRQWQWLRWLLGEHAGARLPATVDLTRTLAVVPGLSDPPTVIVSGNGRREDYEAAIEAAVAVIGARPVPYVPRAQRPPARTAPGGQDQVAAAAVPLFRPPPPHPPPSRPSPSPPSSPPSSRPPSSPPSSRPPSSPPPSSRPPPSPPPPSAPPPGHLLPPAAATGGPPTGQHRLNWPGSLALRGGPRWHGTAILALLFTNVVAIVLSVLAYHQIEAAGAGATAAGRRALIWCWIYGGLAIGFFLATVALIH